MDFEATFKSIGFTDDQIGRLESIIRDDDYIRSVFDGVRIGYVSPAEAFLTVIETVAGITRPFNGIRGFAESAIGHPVEPPHHGPTT